MKAAEATAKYVITKTPENERTGSELPNESDWSRENAIHDWENEGGALNVQGSLSSA